jgi:hypothetical protein
MTEELHDLFISHASADKARFIQPLADRLEERKVTFWLDNVAIGWGDSVPLKINEGLRLSRYVLLRLSKNFLKRPWPESELASAVMLQNATGQKRVLPLILDSKELVLQTYPLLAQLAYKVYPDSPDTLADEIASFVRPGTVARPSDNLNVTVESVHTGKLCSIDVSPRVSLRWLIDRAQSGLGLSDRAETGAYQPFRVRWVLVDARAENDWLPLPRRRKRQLSAVISTSSGPKFWETDSAKLSDVGVVSGTVFHLYAIEDVRYNGPAVEATRK